MIFNCNLLECNVYTYQAKKLDSGSSRPEIRIPPSKSYGTCYAAQISKELYPFEMLQKPWGHQPGITNGLATPKLRSLGTGPLVFGPNPRRKSAASECAVIHTSQAVDIQRRLFPSSRVILAEFRRPIPVRRRTWSDSGPRFMGALILFGVSISF